MSRVVALVNPTAGGGRGAQRWRRSRRNLPDAASILEILAEDAEASRERLRELLAQGDIERVLAVGGDGTAHLVANVLLEQPPETRPIFGLVPAGTGSDLARGLKLPRRPQEALLRALEAPAAPLDAIALETDDGRRRHVLNIASGGLSGAVVKILEASPQRGQLSYLLSTLRGLWSYTPATCRVLADGQEIHRGDLFLAAVANGRFFGKGMPVAPDAVTDDGLLDLVIVPPVPRWKLPLRLPLFFLGRHVQLPAVIWQRAREIRLEPEGTFPPFELDGELFTAGSATLRIVPGALRIAGRKPSQPGDSP